MTGSQQPQQLCDSGVRTNRVVDISIESHDVGMSLQRRFGRVNEREVAVGCMKHAAGPVVFGKSQ